MNVLTETPRGSAIGLFQPSKERLDRLGAWYAAEYPSLLRFAYFVAGERAQAEDLVQEAFVRMYRAGARAERVGIKSYARATIVNLARSGARRRVRAPAEAPGTVEAHDPGARDEVWRALLTLSPRQRACIALRYYDDLSEREIAAALGTSVGSVKKHTNRALIRLRDLLGRDA